MGQIISWDDWQDVHTSPDQQKRLKSGQSAQCTPISIDAKNQSGAFRGSSGNYITNLTSCTCIDFSRRHLPCKHMYRLALELGIMTGSYKSDPSQIPIPKTDGLSFEEVVSHVEVLPENAQILLKDILSEITSKHIFTSVSSELFDVLCILTMENIIVEKIDFLTLLSAHRRNELNKRISALGIPFKKNLSLDDLCQWCLDNIPEHIQEICYDTKSVVLSNDFWNQRSNLYKYLHRKFDYTEYLDPYGEMVSVPICQQELPFDTATKFLIKYGYYDASRFGFK